MATSLSIVFMAHSRPPEGGVLLLTPLVSAFVCDSYMSLIIFSSFFKCLAISSQTRIRIAVAVFPSLVDLDSFPGAD